MKGVSTRLLAVFVLALIQAALAGAEELSAQTIAERARDKDQENLKKYGAASCRLVEIKEELNEKGMVEDREEKRVYVAVSAAPIPGGQETRRIAPDMPKASREDDRSILDHLEMFEWKLEAEDSSQGEPCYRLAFSPKKPRRLLAPRDAVLSSSHGRCWVAKSDFSKIRLEGRLVKPLEVMGFLVTVREVDFLTTTQRLTQGAAAPLQVRYRFRVEVFPFFEIHERHTQRFEFPAVAKN